MIRQPKDLQQQEAHKPSHLEGPRKAIVSGAQGQRSPGQAWPWQACHMGSVAMEIMQLYSTEKRWGDTLASSLLFPSSFVSTFPGNCRLQTWFPTVKQSRGMVRNGSECNGSEILSFAQNSRIYHCLIYISLKRRKCVYIIQKPHTKSAVCRGNSLYMCIFLSVWCHV